MSKPRTSSTPKLQITEPGDSRVNRRRFERFRLSPMYHGVQVRLLDEPWTDRQGHCWDISEGGVSFELDEPIAPGTPVVLQIELPPDETGAPVRVGPGRSVFVFANVVWLTDDDGIGPARMAAVFTRFAREGDETRLIRSFCSGRFARAA
ncbi:MAG: PilZ domain-containing protein [Phycisphaerales bacterium]